MNQNWNAFLTERGAQIDTNSAVVSFGNPQQELKAAGSRTVIADLSQFGLLHFSGDDAQLFLNNLLSSDIKHQHPGQAQYSSFSTPKGRMLASMLVTRSESGFLMQLPASLREAMQRKLSMYILRSKVKVVDAGIDTVLLGLAGPDAAAMLKRQFGVVPSQPMEAVFVADATLTQLAPTLFQVHANVDTAQALFTQAQQLGAIAVGEPAWRWLLLQIGFAWIYPATQEQFVAQMANMELVGAVSFTKGCYPGQEIVARTQYLGKLKRRMALVHIACDIANAPPGRELYSPELPGQAIGMLADSAPSPEGGVDALAVVQVSCWEHGVTLGASDGPALSVRALPYQVP